MAAPYEAVLPEPSPTNFEADLHSTMQYASESTFAEWEGNISIERNIGIQSVVRGARGQLAYDPDQLDDKTRQRVLRNRASARLARERQLVLRQEERAELLRLTEMNSVLEAQLQAAMGWIEAHQRGPPAPPPQA